MSVECVFSMSRRRRRRRRRKLRFNVGRVLVLNKPPATSMR